MRYDTEHWNYRVHTPDGDGTVVAVAEDIKTLTRYATVQLDNNKGVFEYYENELTTIEAVPKSNNLFRGNPEKHEATSSRSTVRYSDVIKALECCQLSNIHQEEDCNNCPFNELPQSICQNLLAYHALQIIKRGTR